MTVGQRADSNSHGARMTHSCSIAHTGRGRCRGRARGLRGAASRGVSVLLAAAACLAALAAVPVVHGAVVSGTVDDIGGFMFLDKFCFDTTDFTTAQGVRAGQIPADRAALMRFTKLTSTIPVTVAVYNDDVDFEALLEQGDELSCDELMSQALFTEVVQAGGQPFEKVVWQASRPRFWFVSVAACGANKNETVALDYELQMLNPGAYLSRQFSKDKQGEFEAYMVAMVVCTGMAAFMICGAFSKFKAESLASAFRVVACCVLVEVFSIACMLVHNAVYADDGIGVPAVRSVGQALDMLQNVVFMLLLVTMMKGWKTSYRELKTRVIICNIAFGSLLVLGYALVFMWEVFVGRPANAFYLYESPPGIGIVVIRIFVTFWFLWSSYKRLSKSHSKAKKRFFLKFMILGLSYFLLLPLLVVIAAILQPWVRSKIVVIMTLAVNTLAYVPVGYLMWPSRMNDVFNTVETIEVRARGSKPREVDDGPVVAPKQFAATAADTPGNPDGESKRAPAGGRRTPTTAEQLNASPTRTRGRTRTGSGASGTSGPRPMSGGGFGSDSRRPPSGGGRWSSPSTPERGMRGRASSTGGGSAGSPGLARPRSVRSTRSPGQGGSSRLLLTPSHHIPRSGGAGTLPPLPPIGTGSFRAPPLRAQADGDVIVPVRPPSGAGSARSGSGGGAGVAGHGEWQERVIVDASNAPYRSYSRHMFTPP